MIVYKIPLTGLKQSTNKIYAGTHWKKRKDSADAVHSVAAGFCRPIQRVESYPVCISYRFFFKTRALDTTNCAYMVKMFEDALRALEIIKDDSPKYIRRTIIESIEQGKERLPALLQQKGKKAFEENEDYVEITINSI